MFIKIHASGLVFIELRFIFSVPGKCMKNSRGTKRQCRFLFGNCRSRSSQNALLNGIASLNKV